MFSAASSVWFIMEPRTPVVPVAQVLDFTLALKDSSWLARGLPSILTPSELADYYCAESRVSGAASVTHSLPEVEGWGLCFSARSVCLPGSGDVQISGRPGC